MTPDRERNMTSAVACLCSQAFGSVGCEGGVDPAVLPVCPVAGPMATEAPQIRQEAYNTRARFEQVLKSFCGYSMGVDLTSVVDPFAHAGGKDMQDLCGAIGTQTIYDPTQVGKFIASGHVQAGVEPARERAFTSTLATDSTFFLKQGGTSNTSHIDMASGVATALTAEGTTFDMRSAKLMAVNGGGVGK